MTRGKRTAAAVGTGVLGILSLTAVPAAASSTIVVSPGQSIQSAVNRASAGDTVLLKPGTYRQSVLVSKNGISIRGSGGSAGGTVLQPGPTTGHPCDSGICVLGRPGHVVTGVRVSDLLARGYPGNGVIAMNTQGLWVQNVIARDNGGYGIARFASSGGGLLTNITSGSAEAGLYVGDSPHANAFVAGNESYGNLFGIFYRHSQHATFENNNLHDNCAGFLALADPASPPVGKATVRNNVIRHNNNFCPPDEEGPALQGAGIVLVGAEGMTIVHNAVLSNRGATPFSGGIVLQNGNIFGAGPTTRNTVANNTAFQDSPADLVDHSGGSNTLRGNRCTRSVPAGLCR
jgi:hypothetical protein